MIGKINVLLTEANGNLTSEKEMILRAVKTAEEYAFSRLKIDWDIDMLITNRLHNILIPEDGVGGRTRSSDFIELAIDGEKTTGNLISEMIVHELCHAVRWGKNNEWVKSLFDDVVFEGLACALEAEFAKSRTEKSFFIRTIFERSDDENEKIFELLWDELNSDKYDYDMIFFSGNDKLPRWSGYSLGYYLVKKYLERSGENIEDVFADKYADFRQVLDV